jgi:glutathione S-transferase
VAKPILTYFDARARADPIRLALEELGIAYEDRRIMGEWAQLKPKTPFGALPSYKDGALEIFQTHAILRHLARVHDLYGTTEAERIRCDIVEEAFADLNNLIGGALWRADFAATRGDFIELELSPRLGQLEGFLNANPEGPAFWVGSAITFVDLIALALLDCAGSIFPEAICDYDDLKNFCDGIARRPRIGAYLQSDRRPGVIMYGPEGAIVARSLKGWITPV